MIIEVETTNITIKELLKMKGFSSAQIRKLKKNDNGILLNGIHATVRTKLELGDELYLMTEDDETNSDITTTEPVDLPVDIIFEDSDLIVVNKPQGMPVHPSQNHHNDTLANAMAFLGYKNIFRPINRLDSNTSGLVLIAKNSYIAAAIGQKFKNGEVSKTYYAILDGVPEEREGTIDAPIGRKEGSIIERCVTSEGQNSITDYRVVAENGEKSLVCVTPKTGRTHQIRVHFAHIGCPIHGDGLYGKEADDCPGQMLHAYSMEFIHPVTKGLMQFSAPTPQSWNDIKSALL